MTDRIEREALPRSDDVGALDAELSSIQYEERPSFGPELRAELAKAWAEGPRARPTWPRYLAAAALAGLLLGSAAVPSARASLVRLIGVFVGAEPAVPNAPAADVTPTPMPATVEEDAADDAPHAPRVRSVEVPELIVGSEPLPSEPPTPPRMLDRARAQALLEDAYPERLQHDGVGGTVWLRLWVDTNGMAGLASVSRGSGIRELDRAALEVAPLLRFEPAMQAGAPLATWIEFPVLFEPDEVESVPVAPPAEDPLRLPIVHMDAQWEFDTALELASLPGWDGSESERLTPVENALVDAIGDPIVRRSLGPVRSIVSGVAPEGRAPARWRTSATEVLLGALDRSPANPAPLLALGRIRVRQGLRTEARMLFEQGLQIAIRDDASVAPELLADLHYERGMLIRDNWLAASRVGRVHAYAFEEAQCLQARSFGRVGSGFASVERLIGWNYLCPVEMSQVFEIGFEPKRSAVADLSLMMGSFRAAIAASPGHVGANVGMLLTLADEKRWSDVLAGARRFARHAEAHPHALLLAGLALQRLGSSDEADAHFRAALERLPQEVADELCDVSFVIDPGQVQEYRRLWGQERRDWEAAFWATKDRTPRTAFNEREVEHLARSAYAYLRFGGVASDPGEVWVRFGGPNQVHVVDEGAGQLTEFWDYGSGPDITFVRWVGSQSMDLTPEGRAYVDDLGKTFPPQ